MYSERKGKKKKKISPTGGGIEPTPSLVRDDSQKRSTQLLNQQRHGIRSHISIKPDSGWCSDLVSLSEPRFLHY